MTRVTALVPARNEADRVAATVNALRSIAAVDAVVVVDDASVDATASAALEAGAAVLRLRRRAGKGGAIERALARTARADVWLLADADLSGTAARLGPVLDAVLNGEADLAIAVPPPQAGGGFGMVRAAAAWAVRAACGFRAAAPLSGQRAIVASALESCRPLASGFGVETAMTIDAVRAGCRVVEVPAEVAHRPTGRTLRGFAHRARQAVDILVAAATRIGGLR